MQIFSSPICGFFLFSKVSFEKQRFFILMKSNLSTFLIWIIQRTPWVTQGDKKKKTPLPCFLLDLHLGFTFRSKIHFKLIINMMWCIGWDSFFCTWMFNYSFAHFVEGLFLSLNCYGTFAKNQLTTYIWVLSVLCCSTVCSVCLSFHQYHCLDYSRFIVSFESVSVIFVIFRSFLLYA